MKHVNSPIVGVKETIEEIVAAYGGWRPAARALGTDYQRLQSLWKAKKVQEVFDMLEAGRRKTGKTKSAMWDSCLTKKKE